MKNQIPQLLADSTNLGTFEPPSEAFGFKVGSSAETGFQAATTLERILSVALGGVTLIAGVYLLFIFLIAAFNWLSAGGDSGKVEKARDSMIQGLIGLTLIVATYAIMGVISAVFGIQILRPGTVIRNLAPISSP